MTIISLVAIDQALSVALKPTLASGDQNSVTLHVDFDTAWDGYDKSAVFFTEADKETVYEKMLDVNGDCIIPHEVLAKSGLLFIGVRGAIPADAAIKTSNLVKYKVVEGAPAGNGTTEGPTESVYLEFLETVHRMEALYEDTKEIAQSVRDDADNGKFDCTHEWNGTVLTIKSPAGTSSADLKGETGVGVASVEQTTTSEEDDGNNVITVTMTDGTTATFTVQNGSKGSTGETGSPGADGYTPVKGTDYYTEEEKTAFVNEVLAALPTWEGGSY